MTVFLILEPSVHVMKSSIACVRTGTYGGVVRAKDNEWEGSTKHQ